MPDDEDERVPFHQRYQSVSRWYKLSADRPRVTYSNEDYLEATMNAVSEIRAVMTSHTKLPGFQTQWNKAKQSTSTLDDFIELATLSTLYNIGRTAERQHNAFKLKQPFTLPTNKDQRPCRGQEAVECLFISTVSQVYTGEIKQTLLSRHAAVDADTLELDLNRKLETITVNTWYAFTNAVGGALGYAVETLKEIEAPRQTFDGDAVSLDDYIIFGLATTAHAARETVRYAYNNGPLLMSASHVLVSVARPNDYGALTLTPMMYSGLMLAGSYGIEYVVPGQFSYSPHSNFESIMWIDENGQYTVNRALANSAQLVTSYARPIAHVSANALSVTAKAYSAVNALQHNCAKTALWLTVGALYEGSSAYYRGMDYGSYTSALQQGGPGYAAKLLFYDVLAINGVILDVSSIHDIFEVNKPLSYQQNKLLMIDEMDDLIQKSISGPEQFVSGFLSMVSETNQYTLSKLSSATEAAGEAVTRHTTNIVSAAGSTVKFALDVTPGARQVLRGLSRSAHAFIKLFKAMAHYAGVPLSRIKAATTYIISQVSTPTKKLFSNAAADASYIGNAAAQAAAGASKMAADNLLWVANKIMSVTIGETDKHREDRLLHLIRTGEGYHSELNEADVAMMHALRKRSKEKWADTEQDTPQINKPVPVKEKEGVSPSPIELEARARGEIDADVVRGLDEPVPFEEKEGVPLSPVELRARAGAAVDGDVVRGLVDRAAIAEDVGRAVVQQQNVDNVLDGNNGLPQIHQGEPNLGVFDPDDEYMQRNLVGDPVSERSPKFDYEGKFGVIPRDKQGQAVEGAVVEYHPLNDFLTSNLYAVGPEGKIHKFLRGIDPVGGDELTRQAAMIMYGPSAAVRFVTPPEPPLERMQALQAQNRLARIDPRLGQDLQNVFGEVDQGPLYIPLTRAQAGAAHGRYGNLMLLESDIDIYAVFNEISKPFQILRDELMRQYQIIKQPFNKQPPPPPPPPDIDDGGGDGGGDWDGEGGGIPPDDGFNQFPNLDPKPADPGYQTIANERATRLRPFFPIGGEDVFNKTTTKQDIISEERLRATNAELGMVIPNNWPLGSVDNPIYIARLAEENRRFYGGALLSSHAFYSGGTMTEDTLYGSYK